MRCADRPAHDTRQLQDSPAGFLESWRGYRQGSGPRPSLREMELPPLLALNAGHRTIGEPLVGFAIQGYLN
jgi:hypothetical protein